MKRRVSVITVLSIVISLICTTSLYVYASVSALSGRGIIDDTTYYIYTGNGSYMTPVSNNSSDWGPVQTLNNAQLSDSRYMWMVDQQTDGTFTIRSFEGNGRYLRAYEDMSVNVHFNVNDSVNFDICRIDCGTFEGKYTIMNGDNYVTMENNSIILTEEPSDFSYWTFMTVQKGVADCYSYSYGEFNSTNINIDVENYYDSWGYNGFFLENYVDTSDILDFMTENDISIFAGLGQAGAIITNPDKSTDTMIMAEYELTEGFMQQYVYDLPNNAFARSRCIIYLSSCSGIEDLGNDGSYYNLVDATYAKGAHYVLGFKVTMESDLIKPWLTRFIQEIDNGGSIEYSVEKACVATGLYDGSATNPDLSNYIYFRGDGDQYLNF